MTDTPAVPQPSDPPAPATAPDPDPATATESAPAQADVPPSPEDNLLHVTCEACGAQVGYAPGTSVLRCTRCGHEQNIATGREVVEHSYDDWAALKAKPVATIGKVVLECQNCGATTETDQIAGTCRFCKGPLVPVDNPPGLVAPEAVVPFGVAQDHALDAFRKWARSRHFAPRAMKRISSTDSMAGTYVPHWTFDARTATDYTGQRGDYYYTTETRTVSDGDGGTRTETYQQRHTAWHHAEGHVERSFDDVLVPASHRVPDKRLEQMGPWQLSSAKAFQPTYLAGFAALRYDVDPDTGLGVAQGHMSDVINGDCRRDIGGDEQRVDRMNISYAALMFKLVLLPLWIATYATGGKTFNVYVNANTGEVVGDRPYSKLKIILFVLAILVVVAAIVLWIVLAKHK